MNIPDTFGLRRGPIFKPEKDPAMPMPTVVRPRRLTNGVADDWPDADALAAVEQALQSDPRPLPNSGDAVVQAFIEMGKNIAQAMRKAGDACLEQGQRRKDEYYKAAEVAERKAEFQAREAGQFIDTIATCKDAMLAKLPPIPQAPADAIKESISAAYAETDRALKAAEAESPTEPEPPKAA